LNTTPFPITARHHPCRFLESTPAGIWGLVVWFLIWCLIPAAGTDAAFYRYRDDNNRYYFVDDVSKIPEAYRHNMQVYQERTDNLNDQDKKAFEAKESEKREKARQLYLQHLEQVRSAARQDALSKAKPAKAATTKVKIIDNQVLVPVMLGYRGSKTETLLLLDTGANITTVYREVARRIGIRQSERVNVQVVGGKRIRAGVARLSYIKAGEAELANPAISIIEHQGVATPFSGFLGMNFLKHFEFRIDYAQEIITFTPRQEGMAP